MVKAVVLISMDDDLLELQDQHHHKILGMEADIDALTRELGETVRPATPSPAPADQRTPPSAPERMAPLSLWAPRAVACSGPVAPALIGSMRGALVTSSRRQGRWGRFPAGPATALSTLLVGLLPPGSPPPAVVPA